MKKLLILLLIPTIFQAQILIDLRDIDSVNYADTSGYAISGGGGGGGDSNFVVITSDTSKTDFIDSKDNNYIEVYKSLVSDSSFTFSGRNSLPNCHSGMDITDSVNAYFAGADSGICYLPTGIYYISGDITGCWYGGIVGDGIGRTVLKVASNTDIIFKDFNYLTLENLTLDGDSANNLTASSFNFQDNQYFNLYKIRVIGCKSAYASEFYSYNGRGRISYCIWDANVGSNVKLTSLVYTNIESCFFLDATIGLYANSKDLIVMGSVFYGNSTGLYLAGSTASDHQATKTIITGNHINHQIGVGAIMLNCRWVSFVNNEILGNGSTGLFMRGCKENTIDNNVIHSNSTEVGINYANIRMTTQGGWSNENNIISGNVIDNMYTSEYAISGDTNQINNVITDNFFGIHTIGYVELTDNNEFANNRYENTYANNHTHNKTHIHAHTDTVFQIENLTDTVFSVDSVGNVSYDGTLNSGILTNDTINSIRINSDSNITDVSIATFYGITDDENTGITTNGSGVLQLKANNIAGLEIDADAVTILKDDLITNDIEMGVGDTLSLGGDIHITRIGTGYLKFVVDSINIFGEVWKGFQNIGDSLIVDGYIRCDSIYTLKAGAWADYVFEKDYNLPTFEEQMELIKVNKHLPSLQPTNDDKYISNGNIQRRLEGVVEELEKAYLYMEQMQKEIDKLKKQLK